MYTNTTDLYVQSSSNYVHCNLTLMCILRYLGGTYVLDSFPHLSWSDAMVHSSASPLLLYTNVVYIACMYNCVLSTCVLHEHYQIPFCTNSMCLLLNACVEFSSHRERHSKEKEWSTVPVSPCSLIVYV